MTAHEIAGKLEAAAAREARVLVIREREQTTIAHARVIEQTERSS